MKEKFIAGAREFLERIKESMISSSRSSRLFKSERQQGSLLWHVTGKNNGILGTSPDQKPIVFTGMAIWDVRSDGKLVRNRVERAAWELFQ
jgi:hypothetical protein